jgi:hypothetical protein
LAIQPDSLGPVRQRTFVPMSKLQLAAWSQDKDGELDMSRVKEIRVG